MHMHIYIYTHIYIYIYHVHGSFLKSLAWLSDPQHFDLDASTDHLFGQMSDGPSTAHPAEWRSSSRWDLMGQP